jgi:hypothetical protein
MSGLKTNVLKLPPKNIGLQGLRKGNSTFTEKDFGLGDPLYFIRTIYTKINSKK